MCSQDCLSVCLSECLSVCVDLRGVWSSSAHRIETTSFREQLKWTPLFGFENIIFCLSLPVYPSLTSPSCFYFNTRLLPIHFRPIRNIKVGCRYQKHTFLIFRPISHWSLLHCARKLAYFVLMIVWITSSSLFFCQILLVPKSALISSDFFVFFLCGWLCVFVHMLLWHPNCVWHWI